MAFENKLQESVLNYKGEERVEKIAELVKDENFKSAHPTPEHFFPMLVIAGLMGDCKATELCEGKYAGLNMSSFIFE